MTTAFADFYWSDVHPRYVEHRISSHHHASHLGVLDRLCGIGRKTSRHWFGFDGAWAIPSEQTIQTMIVRLDMSDEDADELWSAWLVSVRSHQESIHRPPCGRALRGGT